MQAYIDLNKELPDPFPSNKVRFDADGHIGINYLDPKTSRWLSTDPALGEYMTGSNAGAGGIYNQVNFNLYHYGNNNPVKYSDPDGKSVLGKVLGYGCYIAAGAVLLAGTAVCSDNCRHNGCCCSSSSSHLGWKINGSRNRYFSD